MPPETDVQRLNRLHNDLISWGEIACNSRDEFALICASVIGTLLSIYNSEGQHILHSIICAARDKAERKSPKSPKEPLNRPRQETNS